MRGCSKNLAIEAIRVMADRRREYDQANIALKKINPDFPATVTAIDPKVETAVVKVLDDVLGDGIASYFLYECMNMGDGGRITEDGVDWPMRTIDDVRAYVWRQRS